MDLEQLVGEAREREPEPLEPRERCVTGGAAALGSCSRPPELAALLPTDRAADPLIVVVLTILFALA